MTFARKLGLAALLVMSPLLASAADDFLVVANPSVELERISTAKLSRLFLKKVTRWDDGTAVFVVEVGDRKVREAFADRVHSMSLSALRTYWAQMVFSGRDVPPLEKASAEEVLQYVRSHPGAVAIVPAGTPATGVKRVIVE